MLREELTIISTKEKIKKEALTLFARKGFHGTSVNDIAEAVGIIKSSLYSHYSGKEDIFTAVSEDVSRAFGMLFERLLAESKDMEIREKLRYHFVENILYLYRNPEIQLFSNVSLFHVPKEVYGKIRSDYLVWEKPYRSELAAIFAEGMEQGIIRQGDPMKKVWSMKIKRDGVAAWLLGSPDLNEDSIEDFWQDFWFGVIDK